MPYFSGTSYSIKSQRACMHLFRDARMHLGTWLGIDNLREHTPLPHTPGRHVGSLYITSCCHHCSSEVFYLSRSGQWEHRKSILITTVSIAIDPVRLGLTTYTSATRIPSGQRNGKHIGCGNLGIGSLGTITGNCDGSGAGGSTNDR